MDEITQILEALKGGRHPGSREAATDRLQRTAQDRRRTKWPASATATRCNRPPWSTRPTCACSTRTAASALGQPRPLFCRRRRGHAAHPRREHAAQDEPQARRRPEPRNLGRSESSPPSPRTRSSPSTKRSRKLEEEHPEMASVAVMRYFAGMTHQGDRHGARGLGRALSSSAGGTRRAWLRREILDPSERAVENLFCPAPRNSPAVARCSRCRSAPTRTSLIP